MVAEVHNIYPRNGQHPLVLFIEHCSHFRFLLHPKEQAQCLPVTHLSVHRLFPCRIYHVSGPENSKAVKIYGGFLSVAAILLLVTFIAVRLGLVPDSIFHGRHAAENIAFMNALANISLNAGHIIVICLPLIAAIYFFRTIRKKNRE